MAASACCMAREKRPPSVWASSSRRGSGTIWALAMVPTRRVVADWSWRSWATQVPGLSVSVPASRRERLRSSTTSTWLLCSGVRPALARAVGQLVGGGLEVLDGVREGGLVARGPRLGGDHGALGDRQVVDRGTQHRDLVAGGRGVGGLGQVAAHAQAAEGRRQQQRDGQGKGELAAQRPTGDLEQRSTSGAGGGGCGAHGSPVSSSQTLPSRRPTDWKGVLVNVGSGRDGACTFFGQSAASAGEFRRPGLDGWRRLLSPSV